MTRSAIPALGAAVLLMVVVMLAIPVAPMSPGPAEAGQELAQRGLMQCMEQCIRHEGGNSSANKDTCKARCANVPATGGPGAGGGKDCMAVHKDCLAGCTKSDRGCSRACRKRLLNCK